ncbi:hypothetical protein GCM10009748_24340 [Agromyces lapidis]
MWDLVARLGRRWYVLVAGVLLTGLALVVVLSVTPTYFAHVHVVFVPPASSEQNILVRPTDSLVNLAGVVARSVQSGGSAQPVSAEVTLLGEGETEGFLVRQPNRGGQWQYEFVEPVIDVQAVGATPDEAMASLDRALAEIDAATTELQDAQGVPESARVVTTLNPSTPQLESQSGSRVRAVTATVLIGVILTLSAAGLGGAVPRRLGAKSSARGA